MAYENLCFSCFCEKPIIDRPCPKCGDNTGPNNIPKNCLTPGTVLNNRYVVGKPIGVGGFGITYKCLDLQIGGVCAVKEYLPSNMAGRNRPDVNVYVQEGNLEKFNKMMRSFANEANLLQTFSHKNVITCYDSFFENNTAYYVMEYCDGIDLRRYTQNFSRKLECEEGLNILKQVMSGLEYIHSKGILHRDIKPDNIYITSNKTVKILDFGSARNEMEQYKKELSAIVTVGYAPIEQYGGRGVQGHYTDVYALGATFYHLFTGQMPMESTQRVSEDKLEPFSSLRPDLPDNLKFCIERCMVLSKNSRIQDIGEMRRILETVNPTPVSNSNIQYNGQQIKQQSYTSQQYFVPKKPSVPVSPSGIRRAVLSERICANLLDNAIYGLVYLLMLVPLFVSGQTAAAVVGIFMYPLFVFGVSSAFEIISGKTIGKMIMGQGLLDSSFQKPDSNMIFKRNFIKMLGVILLLFANGDVLPVDTRTNTIVYSNRQ